MCQKLRFLVGQLGYKFIATIRPKQAWFFVPPCTCEYDTLVFAVSTSSVIVIATSVFETVG